MSGSITWDGDKNEANKRKHGVSFEEASELFKSGADYLELYDEAHSEVEDRFIAIGLIEHGIVLVIWTEQYEETTRIISARWATTREKRLYWEYAEGVS